MREICILIGVTMAGWIVLAEAISPGVFGVW